MSQNNREFAENMTMSPALPDIEALVEPGSRSLPKSMVMVPRTKLRELV